MLKFDFNFIWTILNLLLTFVILRFFLFKPIKKVIDKRREIIDEQLNNAKDAQAQADTLKNQYENALAGVDSEKKQIIANARADAKTEYEKIVDRAKTDAEKIKSDAQKIAQSETEKTRLTVKEGIAQLAMDTVAKVVGEKSSAEIDSSIYDKFLNERNDNQ